MTGKVRIGYVLGSYPTEPEREKRIAAVRSRVDESIELHFLHVEEPMNVRNWTSRDTLLSESSFIEAFKRAENEGCLAVIPDGMLDLGVEAGRSSVAIPVVAPFQAALHVACCLGSRIGVIHYTTGFVPALWAKVRYYGMSESVVAINALDIEMMDLANQAEEVKRLIVLAGRRLIKDHGAEVIVPSGPGLCPVQVSAEWLSEELNAPVVEGIGAPLHVAAALARLRLTQSSIRWPRVERPH